MPVFDKRGKHSRQNPTKYTENIERSVKGHIRSFPTNQSHYTCTHSNTRRYLDQELIQEKMYRLYVVSCQEKNITPIKKWFYSHIFNIKFNLSTHCPRKDTCKKCDVYKTQISAESNNARKKELEAEHKVHLRKAKAVRSSLNNEHNKREEGHDTFAFDLQKVLSLPRLTTNEVYYCRQLSVYNLEIHSLSTGEGYMNVWHKGIASRGSEEIASCLYGFIVRRSLLLG